MPYKTEIDERIEKVVSGWKNTDRKKMFGGICRLMHGNMFCGVYKDYLILRLGEQRAEKALETPFARPFDITGKPMKGWVMVEERGFESDSDLKDWLEKARDFVKTLPPK
jgi:TfoX/Sxy family transcriptional regulator of competence genes